MYYSKLAAPILLVADCTQAPPLDLAEEVLGSEILAYARQHPSQAHALIWSRLIITTILSHYFPDEFEKAVIEDEFEDSVSCKDRSDQGQSRYRDVYPSGLSLV